MSRALADLKPHFRSFAVELLARLAEAGIPVMIICTGRTQEEQDEAVRTGHSKVQHSRHQDGEAIDVAPYEQYQLHGPDKLEWSTKDPAWQRIGAIAEGMGLRWGGRFGETPGKGDGWDPGHVEWSTRTAPPQEGT